MHNFKTILVVAAFVCFVIAAIYEPFHSRLVAAGLACLTFTQIG